MMPIGTHCKECVTDESLCINCIDNPCYKYVPKISQFRLYNQTCSHNHTDCIHDPAYIRYMHPETYLKLYGNIPIDKAVHYHRTMEICQYDNEDK